MSKTESRIEFPGGVAWVSEGFKEGQWWGHIIGKDGNAIIRQVTEFGAKHLAAAMNATPAPCQTITEFLGRPVSYWSELNNLLYSKFGNVEIEEVRKRLDSIRYITPAPFKNTKSDSGAMPRNENK